jgi:hypothetical protein
LFPQDTTDTYIDIDSAEAREIERRRANLQHVTRRQHRKVDSSNPGIFLIEALLTAEGERLAEAEAVLTAWRPTFRVLPATNANFLTDPTDWSIRDSDAMAALESIKLREDREGRAEDAGMALMSLTETSASLDKADDDTTTEDEEERPKNQSARRFKSNGQIGTDGLSHEDARFVEIYNYALYLAKGEERIREATMVEDAAMDFTLHIMEELRQGNYEERGQFQGWMAHRWKGNSQIPGFRWRQLLKPLRDEKALVSGLQPTMNHENQAYELGTSTGYVSEDRARYGAHEPHSRHVDYRNRQITNDDEDALTASQASRLATVELTPIQQAFIEKLKEGGSQQKIADALGISLATLKRRVSILKESLSTMETVN